MKAGVLQFSGGENAGQRLRRLKAARDAAATITALAAQHRVCVQAGGHVGLWPLALSDSFAAVYTFEPEAENFANLARNTWGIPHLYAARGVLGAIPQGVRLERDIAKSGHWRTVPGGPIPTYTIDGLGLTALDALVLDVEGDELAALEGAAQTIAQHRPLIWFEALHHTGQLATWLRAHGYDQPQRGRGHDCYARAVA